ncbi:MAG: bifunctional acyl-ACP--phospholipid O-acyltransferase/long-chain-fatty-acid--ACP ligase [Chrysiogenales bacterium]|nr:AMP-binding protein [Candidatus Aminicenantes bacterium]TFG76912.1 MAG: bifunctional acyl-ACP--phospholipid O-acyltransferase/long-chain-fatty-acid--ACP ligase [Chrysiogenales bacterium]
MVLHQEFIKNAKKYSEKLAIIDRTLEKKVTYSKALIASLILARKFKKYDDGFIGIMIPTSAGCMLSILGVLMSGKVPVMINYSTGAANNAEYAQRKCGFKTIIASRALLEKIGCRLVSGMVFIEDIMESIAPADKVKALVKSKLPLNFLLKSVHQGEPDDNLVILFTSGSEKDPKAVQLTHRNIGTNVMDIAKVLTVTSDDIMLANLPLFHVFGHNIDFWLPMLFGMTIVSYANPLEYKKVCTIVREEKVSLMVGTPSFFSGYLRQSDPGDFSSLRVAVAGADKTPDSLRAGFLKKHNLELCEGYGTTETSPVVSTNLPNANKPGSVGKVLPSVRVKIVDINSGETLPLGSEGKILVKGDLVMKGYFDDLEETSLRIKDGWYETGDMGVLDEEGYLWHRGRLKRFVKIGGEMVSLVRVESVLLKLLPEETECCVVEVPDSLKGARIVAALNKEVNQKKMLKAMAAELPAIALPKQFVILEDFPKMGSGKIDFRTITEMVRQQLQVKS